MDIKSQSEKGTRDLVNDWEQIAANYSANLNVQPTTLAPHMHSNTTATAPTANYAAFPPQQIYQQPGGYVVNQPFQYPPTNPWVPGIEEIEELLSPEDKESAIEFIENVMFLLTATLDECDVPNQGGLMDRSEGKPLESTIDLGDYEIVIRRKRA